MCIYFHAELISQYSEKVVVPVVYHFSVVCIHSYSRNNVLICVLFNQVFLRGKDLRTH